MSVRLLAPCDYPRLLILFRKHGAAAGASNCFGATNGIKKKYSCPQWLTTHGVKANALKMRPHFRKCIGFPVQAYYSSSCESTYSGDEYFGGSTL